MSGWRDWLRPLAPVYGAVVETKRWMYGRGWLGSRALEGVVISVGSVSAGGAGKTPVVLLLAEVLGRRGYAVRILTRGHGRRSKAVERVEAAGDARRYGDEPLLLARRTGVPVYVGADRYRAGRMAEAAEGTAAVTLLDDGFQHRRLRRDLDVVLLTRADVEDRLLPAGNLREPLRALRAAGVIVVREEEAASLAVVLTELVGGMEAPLVWRIRRRLWFQEGAARPARPLVFCGIARPQGFFAMLEEQGVRAAGTEVFRDHHAYGERDVERLMERAWAVGADGFCTTEKDAVKLTKAMRRRMETQGPVLVAELQVELLEERAAVEQMLAMVPGLDWLGRR